MDFIMPGLSEDKIIIIKTDNRK